MDEEDLASAVHDLDVTVWVGKNGIESVAEECAAQLEANDVVKVKFLEAARTDSIEGLAVELADRANGEVYDTRGHTAVLRRE